MLVHLRDIPAEGLEKEFSLNQTDLEKLGQDFIFDFLHCQAKVKSVQDQIILEGKYQTKLTATSDLCLVPVPLEFDGEFELRLQPSYEEEGVAGDLELSLDMTDVDYYNGDEVKLGQYFEDQVSLDLPTKTICQPDCKGLCPVCGVDLNKNQCECPDAGANRPFAQLLSLSKPQSV